MPEKNNSEIIADLNKRLSSLEKVVQNNIRNSMLSKGGKPLLTMAEASELLGLKKQTISVLVSKGKIPHYKPNGKNVYFDADELNAWLRRTPDDDSMNSSSDK